MIRYKFKPALAAGVLLAALGCTSTVLADGPDPAALLADMQDALVPPIAQFSRVHISARSEQPGGGSKEWDALVIRERDDEGPHTALSLLTPEPFKGMAILTAPHPSRATQGLWVYTPEERRAVEFSPLEADRQFLTTRFNFEDLALTTRATKAPVLLGSERGASGVLWKVETQPTLDRYYARILTWIADDTRLPLKREYYDRANQLWKVVTYRHQLVDGIPTVTAIDLHDVQSRDVARWRLDAVAYHREKLEQKVLSPVGLGDLPKLAFWRTLSDSGDGATKILRTDEVATPGR